MKGSDMANEWREAELEEWVKDSPIRLMRLLLPHMGEHSTIRILGQQLPCATGIIDLLVWADYSVFVVEFKAVSARTRELGQVTRYADQVERVIENYYLWEQAGVSGEAVRSFIDFLGDPLCPVLVVPVLVAPSFAPNINSLTKKFCLVQATKAGEGFELKSHGRTLGPDENEALFKAMNPFLAHIQAIAEQRHGGR